MRHTVAKLTIVILIIGNCGCDLFSSDPKNQMWVEEDLNEYVLYAYSDSLSIIDVATGTILKHIYDFQDIQSVVSTNDGNVIYLSTTSINEERTAYVGGIYKIDTNTWEYENIYDQPSQLLDNGNGGIFFMTLTTSYLSMFGEINSSSGFVTEIDSINVFSGVKWSTDRYIEVHPSNSMVYAISKEDKFYSFDYSTFEKQYLFPEVPFNLYARLKLSDLGDLMYVSGGPVLNLITEEIEGALPVWYLGSAAARSDNQEVYFTDPGGYANINLPLSNEIMYIYSPEKDSLISSIDIGSLTDLIFLTSKNRYAIVNNWFNIYYIIDLKEREVKQEFLFAKDGVATISLTKMKLATKPASLK